jgi:hypothetical protein
VSKSRFIVAALFLVVASCSGGETTIGSPSASSPSTPTTTTDATIQAPLSPDEALDAAVVGLIDADSYAFEVTVTLATQGTEVTTELEGWVRGTDRELVLRAGSEEVITRVIDGVATVERDGETIEVPLEEASDAPTLDILRALGNISSTSDGEITGSLSASELKDFGFDVKGAADVTVILTASGSLASYLLTGNNGAWRVQTRFFDIGESF